MRANPLQDVSQNGDDRHRQLENHFEVLKKERWFEGVVRKFELKFENRPEWTEDAVAEAWRKAWKTDRVFPTVDELKSWLYVVALREMYHRVKREAKRPTPPWEVERGHARSAEDEALDGMVADQLYQELRDRIRRWASARRRVVADFVLDAAREGEPISGADIVEHVADVLGEEIGIDTAWRLRRQVLARLMDEISGIETEDEEDDDE